MSKAESLKQLDVVATPSAFARFVSQTSDPSAKKERDKVRRNLFGTRDVALSVREFCREQFDALLEASSRQWNFDFVREKPLPSGRYLWEAVATQTVVTKPLEDETGDKTSSNQPKMEKENSVFVPACENKLSLMQTPKKCKTSHFVQTSFKGLIKVQKRRSSKRLLQKRRQRHRPRKASRLGNRLFDSVKRT